MQGAWLGGHSHSSSPAPGEHSTHSRRPAPSAAPARGLKTPNSPCNAAPPFLPSHQGLGPPATAASVPMGHPTAQPAPHARNAQPRCRGHREGPGALPTQPGPELGLVIPGGLPSPCVGLRYGGEVARGTLSPGSHEEARARVTPPQHGGTNPAMEGEARRPADRAPTRGGAQDLRVP